MARSGSGFYGWEKPPLKLAMKLKSMIIQLKHISKGAGVGYDLTYTAPRRKLIAIVPMGYADMVPVTKSGELKVLVNGTMRKVLGKESMDQIVIEGHENDKLGDEVVFFDGKIITLQKFAQMGHTMDANLLTHMSERVDRVYVP
jgi:alanine racemase